MKIIDYLYYSICRAIISIILYEFDCKSEDSKRHVGFYLRILSVKRNHLRAKIRILLVLLKILYFRIK